MKRALVVLILTLLSTGIAVPQAAEPGIIGNWQGTVNLGGVNSVSLRIGLHITKSDAGEYAATLDSIDQGASGIPVRQTTLVGNLVHLDLPNLRATYEGTVSADGNEISGTFTQGAALPLTFKRVDQVETLSRPQTPKPPFPYEAVELSYDNTASGVKLAGTLTMPRGGGPFPAAVMISGSGPQDRDETILGHKPFLVIADYLARHGIAVLRVDDRGVGGSTGAALRTTLNDQAGDVLAGVAFLKTRKEIDPQRIGVIGHSEGGIVGPLAASQSADIRFVVMLAGTGVTGEQVVYRQRELALRAAGAPDAAIAQIRARTELILNAVKSENDENAAAAKIRAAWPSLRETVPEGQRADADTALNAEIQLFNSPDIRSLLFYDPADALRKLRVPVLALNGSRDLQVPPDQNIAPIRAALTAAGNKDFTVTEMPGLNHLFQTCKQCTIAEYATLEETFSPAALQVIGDWIAAHAH